MNVQRVRKKRDRTKKICECIGSENARDGMEGDLQCGCPRLLIVLLEVA